MHNFQVNTADKGQITDPYPYDFQVLFGTGVTVPAVYRLISPRLKGHFGLLAAATAGDRKHLA